MAGKVAVRRTNRAKVTITLDRSKAERLRRDIAAYRRMPPTDEEIALASIAPSALDDDTDWEAFG